MNPADQNRLTSHFDTPDSSWAILKFGGTSVATAARWRTIADLACARVAGGFRTVVVVSAVSGLTNRLQVIVDRELSLAELTADTDAIRTQHLQLIARDGRIPDDASRHFAAGTAAEFVRPRDVAEGRIGRRASDVNSQHDFATVGTTSAT